MKKCLFCKKEIPKTENICPYCGSVKFDIECENSYYSLNSDLQSTDIVEYNKSESNKKIVFVIIGIATLIAIFCFVMFIINAPCKHKYDKTIVSEATFSDDGEFEYVCRRCDDKYTEVIPRIKSVELSVLNKYTHKEEPIENKSIAMPDGMSVPIISFPKQYVLFDIEIKNVLDKDISKVNGTLYVKSGEKTYKLMCVFEELVPANETVIFESYGFDIRDYNGSIDIDAMSVYSADPQSLEYEFVVSDIEFAD